MLNRLFTAAASASLLKSQKYGLGIGDAELEAYTKGLLANGHAVEPLKIEQENLRLIIVAEENLDKHRQLLFDSHATAKFVPGHTAPLKKSPVKCMPDSQLKLICELMFGAVPLSYKGTTTKLHILPPNVLPQRNLSILVTKLFTVDVASNDPTTSPDTLTGPSSWGSVASGRHSQKDYPFPRMTNLHPANENGSLSRKEEVADRDVGVLSGTLPWHPSSGPSLDFDKSKSWDLNFSDKFASQSLGSRLSSLSNSGTENQFYNKIIMSPGSASTRCRSFVHAIGIIISAPAASKYGVQCNVDKFAEDEEYVRALVTQHWSLLQDSLHELQRTLYPRLEQAVNYRISNSSHGGREYSRGSIECDLLNDKDVLAAVQRFRQRVVDASEVPLFRLFVSASEQLSDTNTERWGTQFLGELELCASLLESGNTNFFFPKFLTAMLGNLKKAASENRLTDQSVRILFVTDNASLARRLIFICSWFLKLLFCDSHLRSTQQALELSTVWPTHGILLKPPQDRMQPTTLPINFASQQRALDIPERSCEAPPRQRKSPRRSTSVFGSQASGFTGWIGSWFESPFQPPIPVMRKQQQYYQQCCLSHYNNTPNTYQPEFSPFLTSPKALATGNILVTKPLIKAKLNGEEIQAPLPGTHNLQYLKFSAENEADDKASVGTGRPKIGTYLPRFYPDFTISACAMYEGLEQDILRTLTGSRFQCHLAADIDWSTASTVIVGNIYTNDVRQMEMRRRLSQDQREETFFQNEICTNISQPLWSVVSRIRKWWDDNMLKETEEQARRRLKQLENELFDILGIE